MARVNLQTKNVSLHIGRYFIRIASIKLLTIKFSFMTSIIFILIYSELFFQIMTFSFLVKTQMVFTLKTYRIRTIYFDKAEQSLHCSFKANRNKLVQTELRSRRVS